MSVPPQSLVRVSGRLVDLSSQPLSAIVELQRELTDCPRCGERLELSLRAATGAGTIRARESATDQEQAAIEAKHLVSSLQDHEPVSALSWVLRERLVERLRELFPTAVTESDVELRSELGRPLLAESVTLSPVGAKLCVLYIGGGRTRDWSELQPLDERLTERGLRALWILSGERLKGIRGGLPERTELRAIPLAEEELALIRLGRPLIYHGPSPRELYRVFIPTQLAQQISASGLSSLGQIKLPIRYYNITQLRIRSGEWSLSSPYDAPLPSPPELSARMLKKLHRGAVSETGSTAAGAQPPAA